jgi:sortase (surface protein transpeptidase)
VSFRSLRTLARTAVPVVVLGLALAGPGAASAAGSRLVIPKLGVDVPVAKRLNEGPQIYYRDVDTIGIAGHRTTYTRPFRDLPRLRRGDVIRLDRRVFRVSKTAVIRPWEVWVLRHRGIVLSACHPAGSAAFRFVVVASPIRS